MSSFAKRFIPLCCVVGAVVGLIITQDFGTAVFIAAITTVMFLIGAVKWWHLLTPLPLLIPAFYFAVRTSPTRMNRIRAFLNPDSLDIAANYQASQSLIAISGGGIFGRGFGRGISKYGHLPEDTTDFIFAIIAEELGFVGAIFVIALFVAFVVLGIIVAMRCRDKFAALLAAGIVLTIGIQAAINIGVVTAVLPTKGIPLPFISAGGTSMLLSAAAVGILLNIAKQTSRASDSAGGIGR
jgi:cell division protein FtsW